MIRRPPLRFAVAMATAGALAFTGAWADDTELFVTGFDTEAVCEAPNVLFLIDTSGSMAGTVQTQADWDPAERFDGCFDPDSLYYTSTGEPPDCSAESRVPKAQFFCAAADERLALIGRFKSLFRGWSAARERWEPLEPAAPDRPVECEADRGIHGDGSGGALFAADGPGGPWAADDGAEPAWGSASNVTIFDGNWLNWFNNPPTVTRTRLEVVQEVTRAVIDAMDDLNIAVMRFNTEQGGAVIQAMEPVEAARESAKAVIDTLEPGGFTPLAESLLEAAQYYRQGQVVFGDEGPVASVAGARLGADPAGTVYNSPLDSDGQKNFIVLLSDGEPSRDADADERIAALPGFAELVGPGCDGTGEGRCLDDLAEYLRVADLRPDVPGQQSAVVHTIGFTLDLPLLAATAARGGGRYFQADDTASLTAVLTELTESFNEDSTTFTAPAIAVNAFNRSESLRDVFLSVFAPTNTVRWPGNVKKYRLAASLGADGESVAVDLLDQDRRPAVDPVTGGFFASSRSFWSTEPDGADARLGGAASRLPEPAGRRLFTSVAGGRLTVPGNRIEVGNAALSAARLGVPADLRDAVIAWARGADAFDVDEDGDLTESRLSMGDPLHVAPVAVTYGGSADAPEITLFVSTNDGYLHAIDAATGDEQWAFVPERLLDRLYPLAADSVTSTRSYGLDGEIRVHVANDDGQPGIGGGERVILLFGMRRGGSAVFALDVTARDDPVLLWEIDSNDPDFRDLGQSWSTPVVARLNALGRERDAVLFGGGYDTGQDNRDFRTDNVGNALYMVELETGALLWSAGRPGRGHDLELERMRFSIPAPLRVLDIDGDRLADRIYVGDMGGQLWRFDIVNGQGRTRLVEGGVLASLGAADLGNAPPRSEIRRFYATPDVVPVSVFNLDLLAVNIGSGYRAHPLDTATDDQFFSVRDLRAFQPLDSDDYGEPIGLDELVDITDTAEPLLEITDAGWRLRLVQDAGEKALTGSTAFDGAVLFTSFSPRRAPNACIPGGGANRLYQVDVLSGAPLTNLDDSLDDRLTVQDRSLELAQGGIAPAPVFMFLRPDDGNGPRRATPMVGGEALDDAGLRAIDPSLRRTFWLQREAPANP